jgi:hypothetical protein
MNLKMVDHSDRKHRSGLERIAKTTKGFRYVGRLMFSEGS